MRRLSHYTGHTAAARAAAQDDRDDWMVAVEAVVAVNQDPEGMHRIKVIIPAIDEAVIHDEWVTALVPWVRAPGFGMVGVPALDSEVLLLGRLGEPHTLFYVPRFNEDFQVPAEFADGSRGCKYDMALRLLGAALVQIISGRQLYLGEGSLADVGAPDVKLNAGKAMSVYGQLIKLGAMSSQRGRN